MLLSMTDSFDALRRPARTVFGADAAGYAAGRPDYPPAVYAILRDRCGLRAGADVIEIGPGHGLVTRHLIDAGARVTACEPDPVFAGELADAYPAVRVVATPFEDADAGPADLVVAATSFHWVEPVAGLHRLHAVLRPGGWAAIWWTIFSDPTRPDPLLAAVTAELGFEPGNQRGGTAYQLDTGARVADMRDGAGLVDVAGERFAWDHPMDAAAVRALFASQIAVRRLPDTERERALDAIARHAAGGDIRPMLTVLYTGSRP
jgi:SAM-dependent methyltransferase